MTSRIENGCQCCSVLCAAECTKSCVARIAV
uniref:Uncharacterized protein n=1 Tax=Anguilla anguilla TaxID=7936 RepID=A0A0E9RY93_ANGAN